MENPDIIHFSFLQNPQLKEAMARMKAGDKGECEVKYEFKGSDDQGVDLVVNSVIPKGYKEDVASEHVVPGPISPVSVVMKGNAAA